MTPDFGTGPNLASQPARHGTEDPNWSESLLRAGILFVDRLLRRHYGIREFSHTPLDLLRISIGRAEERLTLPDGTEILPGDCVIDLHLWNERILALGSFRPGLGWASRVKRRIEHSLAMLAVHVEADPSLGQCKALRADAVLLARRRRQTLTRIAQRLGLGAPLCVQPADPGHTMLSFALAWAWHPASALNRPLRATRYVFWISRGALYERYGPPGRRTRGESAPSEQLPR
jgi:hypothetical protein